VPAQSSFSGCQVVIPALRIGRFLFLWFRKVSALPGRIPECDASSAVRRAGLLGCILFPITPTLSPRRGGTGRSHPTILGSLKLLSVVRANSLPANHVAQISNLVYRRPSSLWGLRRFRRV
jgi:hypothetical protein